VELQQGKQQTKNSSLMEFTVQNHLLFSARKKKKVTALNHGFGERSLGNLGRAVSSLASVLQEENDLLDL